MLRAVWLMIALVGAAALGGCSDYEGDFDYVPRPALAEIPPNPPDKNPPVSAFASVIGVHTPDRRDDLPESVEVRFRLENNGPHSVWFDPNSLELMTGDLMSFGEPIARPEEPVTISPGDVVVVDVFFPFPPGHSHHNTDMRSLQLRWSEKIDGSPVTQATSFRRIYPYHYYDGPDPYWGYPYYYGGGVVIVGRGGWHGRWR